MIVRRLASTGALALFAALTLLATASGALAHGASRRHHGPAAPAHRVRHAASVALLGAGSTLVAPLVQKWQADYKTRTGVTLTYGAIGSGGGISAITSRSVDFAASDAPLTPDQARAAKGVVQIPWALSATAVAYNVKGVPNGLHLSGPVLAAIYAGHVKSWSSPRIAALNPHVKLPDTPITPVYRSDGSGDTYAFSGYLSRVDRAWKAKFGQSTQVSFPTGIGAHGNDGMAATLSSTNGAIAYIAIPYVIASHLDYADIENRAGRFSRPGIASIKAAAAAVSRVPKDNAVSLLDPPRSARGAYPIATFTYALVPLRSAKAGALRRFLRYAITAGQRFTRALTFAPLPAAVISADRNTIARIKAL